MNLLRSSLLLSLLALPLAGHAAIPAGAIQATVNDATNRLWDLSTISVLQNPDLSFDDGTTVSFAAPFDQTGAGKLIGLGATDMAVSASGVFDGNVTAGYKVTGGITSAKGIAKVTYAATAKGPAIANGRPTVIAASVAVKLVIDAPNEIAAGVYAQAGAAAGFGSIKEAGALSFPWTGPDSVVGSMGTGQWTLSMNLNNDGLKKIGGDAQVTLSSGATIDFVVKGAYKSANDSSILVLAATPAFKGSSLKVTLSGSTVTGISGKVSGQTIKWVP